MTAATTTVEVFDTTLRDGLQVEGVSATVEDKLRIAEQLDLLGVHFIEGGWPGANPKDIEFFARAATELHLATSTLVAFGSTRRPRGKVDDDATLRNLHRGRHVGGVHRRQELGRTTCIEALQTTLDEGEAMIADSVEFLVGHGRRVLVDMEHFFDGYKAQPRVLAAGARGGGRQGRQPPRAVRHQRRLAAPRGRARSSAPCTATSAATSSIGIHCHDDTGCAVANSMAAVLAGARHVQGTLNGLGERTGNANLTTIIPNLQLKLGLHVPARRPHRAADRGQPPRRRAAQPGRQPAGAVRRLVGVRPQGRPAHERHRPGQGRLRARRPGARRQRHPLRRQRDGRAGDDPR